MTTFPHTDPFILLRDSLLTVVRLGLNDDVPEDTESLNRISHLVPNKFRRFLITHYSVFRGCILELAGAINRDIGVWESDLSKFVRDKFLETMPSGAGTDNIDVEMGS